MQEQAALLPGSQAGEEGTSVWSHGAHRFPLTSTPTSLPPSLSLHSSHFSLSLSIRFFSLILHLSYVIDIFLSLLLTFVSFHLPHRPTQIHTVENKIRLPRLTGEGAQTHKQTMFSHWKQDVPQIEGYFYMSVTWFDSKKHSFYIYRLCLSPGVEKGCGSCI